MKLRPTPEFCGDQTITDIWKLLETDMATLEGDAVASREARKLLDKKANPEWLARQRKVYEDHQAFLESATPEQLDTYFRAEKARQAMLDAGWEP